MDSNKKKAGRPSIRKDQKKVKPNITLDPTLILLAKEAAAGNNQGFSAWVANAIENEINRSRSIAPADTIPFPAPAAPAPAARDTAKNHPTPAAAAPSFSDTESTDSILAFPEIPLLHAAAGEPFSADRDTYIPTRQLGRGRFAVQIHGTSMSPRYPDATVVILRERDSLKNPVLKKGEIYLFDINGEKTLKIYGSRPATAQEIATGHTYTSPADGKTKIRILKSLNPDFPEIRITEDVSWIGWLDKGDNR